MRLGADAHAMSRHDNHKARAPHAPPSAREAEDAATSVSAVSALGVESAPAETRAPARATVRGVYHISIVAELVETHPQTLRMYERMGLIHPARTRNNIRLYSEADVERVRRIQHLTQDLGVNLAGVEVVFKLLSEMERMQAEAEARQTSLSQELLALREQVAAIFNEGLNGHEKSGRA